MLTCARYFVAFYVQYFVLSVFIHLPDLLIEFYSLMWCQHFVNVYILYNVKVFKFENWWDLESVGLMIKKSRLRWFRLNVDWIKCCMMMEMEMDREDLWGRLVGWCQGYEQVLARTERTLTLGTVIAKSCCYVRRFVGCSVTLLLAITVHYSVLQVYCIKLFT